MNEEDDERQTMKEEQEEEKQMTYWCLGVAKKARKVIELELDDVAVIYQQ
jgi:hypothetical protein